MTSALERLEDGTIKLTIVIPGQLVKKTWDESVEELAQRVKLAGFRKGKAPKKLVEENLNKETIREETLKKLLPQGYSKAIQEHTLRPIMNPKIHVEKLEDPEEKEPKDWQFVAVTCEAPEIELNNYREGIQKLNAKGKIIVPGKEKQEVKFEEIVKTLLENVKVKIPKVLIDQEVDRLLSHLIDDIKKLGLTLDQYLASTGKTSELLRNEYEKKAEDDMKLEFTIQKIAETERITVDDKEIDEAIHKAKNEQEKKQLESNRYLLAHILRQQKALDFLRAL